jgi:hypothetical protein
MTPVFLGTLVLSGLFAGFLHVISGPDHLAAIAPYAVDAKAGAWRTGVRWGFGHSAGVLGVGLFALLLRDALSIDLVSSWGERLVGVVLIAIGAWGMQAAFFNRAASIRDHPDGTLQKHRHEHPAFAVGTVHGLAGSSHLLGVVPALALPSKTAAAAYLILFGVGSIAAMGMFSSVIGWIALRPAANGAKTQSALLALFSAVAIVIGSTWLLSAIS